MNDTFFCKNCFFRSFDITKPASDITRVVRSVLILAGFRCDEVRSFANRSKAFIAHLNLWSAPINGAESDPYNHGSETSYCSHTTSELEFLSTQELQQIIAAGDADTNDELREVAEGKDGILARDIGSGKFEIISDEELQEVLNEAEVESEAIDAAGLFEEEAVSDGNADGLELVSTQMLRVVLGPDGEKQIVTEEPDDSGFDPYDNG